MKLTASFSLPRLALLGLVTLLLFGNCGGGVNGFLTSLGPARRARLRAIIEQERAQRAAARQQLRGRGRHAAYYRIEDTTVARLDSLLYYTSFGQRKMQNRRPKIERQLFRRTAP